MPLSIQEVYTGTTKAAYNKKRKLNNPKKPKPSIPKPSGGPQTLHHMCLAFPKLGGRSRITVVDGAYQIQYLPLPLVFGCAALTPRWKSSSMASKIAKDESISSSLSNSQSKANSGGKTSKG